MESNPTRRRDRRRISRGSAGDGRRRMVLGFWLCLWLLLSGSTVGAAITLDAAPTREGRSIERVPIATTGEAKDYLRIDTPCPLRIQGPGTLTFWVRAHLQAEGPEAVDVETTLEGLTGFSAQRWSHRLKRSSSGAFADSRAGALTGGEKTTLIIPAGLQEVTVTAVNALAAPVYAIFYYDGPPVPVEGARSPSPWKTSASLTLGTIYDDNICRFSEATLAQFQANQEPWKFAITNREDMILNWQIQAELYRDLLFGKRTALRLQYEAWDYVENSIKANDEIQVRLRQNLRSADYVALNYTYAPDNYIKELGDREPFLSRATTPYEYYHFYITRNAFDLDYFWRVRPWLRVMFMSGRVLRFYNQRFLENDLWEWNVGVEPEARYGQFWFRARYMTHVVEARGYDTVGETLELSDNDGDGSYEKDDYALRLTYRPKARPFDPGPAGSGWAALPGAGKRVASWLDRGLIALKTSNIYVQYDYVRQFYTSRQPLNVDPLHVGRLDQSYQPRLVWVSKALWNGVSLEAGIRYTKKTAKSPAGFIGEDDPSEEKDYTGTRVWLQGTRPLW